MFVHDCDCVPDMLVIADVQEKFRNVFFHICQTIMCTIVVEVLKLAHTNNNILSSGFCPSQGRAS